MPTTFINTVPAAAHIRYTMGESSLGLVLVAATDKGVCAVLIGDDDDELLKDFCGCFGDVPAARVSLEDDPRLAAWTRVAVAAIETPSCVPSDDELPLDLIGTAFQQRVWQELRRIPPGTTATYSQIAERIGMNDPAGAARAVGTACGANPIGIIVPCHRVVRRDGSLAGFRWGLSRKAELLKRENTSAVQGGLW